MPESVWQNAVHVAAGVDIHGVHERNTVVSDSWFRAFEAAAEFFDRKRKVPGT